MERENYRLVLEGVINAFPDNPMIPMAAVSKYLHKDVRTLQKNRDFMKLCRSSGNRTELARESLAHWMCGK